MEFRILGPLEVVEDGRPVRLDRSGCAPCSHICCCTRTRPVSADRLIDEVWGPTPPKTAGASLQNYVSRLRKAIGAELIVSQPAGVPAAGRPGTLRPARFERLTAEARRAGEPRERAEKLRAALALWRGPALEDLAFESFARDEVGRLEEARLAALEQRLDADLELGSAGDLVGELEQLVEQHPLRERFRAQLMLALYRAGRQAEALEAYQDARRVLIDELGLEPSEELRGLRAGDPSSRTLHSVADSRGCSRERGPDRRTVTVLFCDLVDSTRLAARARPGGLPRTHRALLRRAVRAPIERHGGTVEKFIGDAVMAVFGVPELHEDDALRAVRAAVEIRSVSGARRACRGRMGRPIEARIGIEHRRGARALGARVKTCTCRGQPASAASQLEERAPAGGVLLGSDTYRLVRDAVRAER